MSIPAFISPSTPLSVNYINQQHVSLKVPLEDIRRMIDAPWCFRVASNLQFSFHLLGYVDQSISQRNLSRNHQKFRCRSWMEGPRPNIIPTLSKRVPMVGVWQSMYSFLLRYRAVSRAGHFRRHHLACFCPDDEDAAGTHSRPSPSPLSRHAICEERTWRFICGPIPTSTLTLGFVWNFNLVWKQKENALSDPKIVVRSYIRKVRC